MAGFDSERKHSEQVTPVTPDFSTALESFNNKVKDISVKIKSGERELASIFAQIDKAKIDLKVQYDKKVSEMGEEYDKLVVAIAAAQDALNSLSLQISERQATKDAISLDNTAKQKEIDAAWDAIRKSSEELASAQKTLDSDKRDAQAYMDSIDEEIEKLNSDKTAFEEDMHIKMGALAKQKADADKAKADADIAIQQANEILAKADKAGADLDARLLDASQILAKADEIKKMAADNETTAAANQAAALQNEKDAREIKVARVALNNKEKELDAREQMLSLAEKKIGG